MSMIGSTVILWRSPSSFS